MLSLLNTGIGCVDWPANGNTANSRIEPPLATARIRLPLGITPHLRIAQSTK
jgi:hypothetical protein